MCHVGIDVGTNTTAPKILMERLGWTLNEAAFATSLYFIFRTIGCFTGTVFLRMMKPRVFFTISIVMMALSMAGLFFGESKMMLYIAIALGGLRQLQCVLHHLLAGTPLCTTRRRTR